MRGLATVSAGFDQDPDKGEYIPFAGLILKIPLIWNSQFFRNSIEAGRVGWNPYPRIVGSGAERFPG
jgi:hypothetical protein